MSTENQISIQIPQADMDTVNTAMNTINTVLAPYLLALSPQQRKTLPKMSDGTLPFVNKTMEYAQSNPQFAPPFLDVPEMKKDLDATNQLTPLLNAVNQLKSNLSDTTMLAGSEAYVASLSYYNSVKMAAKMNVPGAKTIYEDLSKRFAGRPKSSGNEVEN